MKKFVLIITTFLLSVTSVLSQKNDDFPPRWVNKPPKSKKKIFAVGYGSSISQQIAFEKAKIAAFKELSEQFSQTRVKSTKNKIDTHTQATLTEVEIEAKSSRQDSTGRYEAYILLSHKKPKKR